MVVKSKIKYYKLNFCYISKSIVQYQQKQYTFDNKQKHGSYFSFI